MVPSEVPGDDDAQQGSSGKEHEGNGGDSQPEHSGSELATAAAPLSTPDGETVSPRGEREGGSSCEH